MDRHKLDVVSCGKSTTRVQKAICSGFFRNAAKKDPQEGYRTLVDAQMVSIHPSSALFHRCVTSQDFVLYVLLSSFPGNQSGLCFMRLCKLLRSTWERLPQSTRSGWWSMHQLSSSSLTRPNSPSSSKPRGLSLCLTSTRSRTPGEFQEQEREEISLRNLFCVILIQTILSEI